ncbi:MAG TPA: hypothetical protein VF995_02340 [Actinomycetota bacterium]
MSSSASGFSMRLQAGERRDTATSLSAAQRATLTRIADKRDGVQHCDLPAGDLVTLLRSYLVRFSTPDLVEATARGRQALEGDAPAQAPSASADA